MWKAETGTSVDGVLVIDVGALSDILSATGPVSSGGQTFTSQSIVPFLLNGQYQGLTSTEEVQQARHQRDGELAQAAFAAISDGGTKLGPLGTALEAAANARHVLVWSADPTTEAQWQAAGVGGSVGPDDLLLSVLNQGANKLDPYLNVSADMDITPGKTNTSVAITVTVKNNAPAGQPAYVLGDAGHPSAPGTYQGQLQLDLPPASAGAHVVGFTTLTAAGADGQSYALAAPIDVPAGGSVILTYEFSISAPHATIEVDPSARIPGTTWTVHNGHATSTFTDENAHSLAW
jgi:hypothetical protein